MLELKNIKKKKKKKYNKPRPKLFELIRFFNMVCADRFAEMTLVEIV